MSHLINEIKYFYKEIQNEIDASILEKFVVRDLVKDLPKKEVTVQLAEWLLGISVRSEKHTYFIDLIQKLNSDDKDVLVDIIESVIKCYSDREKDEDHNSRSSERNYVADDDDINLKMVRINVLEKENSQLMQEIEELKSAKMEYFHRNMDLEDKNKHLEQQVEEKTYMINVLEQRETSISSTQNDTMKLNIELAELRGKLKVTSEQLTKEREKKEIEMGELREKINSQRREIQNLQEKSLKYDNLMEKMERERFNFNEFHSLKFKLSKTEGMLKDAEDKLREIKNTDSSKDKLLIQIEELNVKLYKEKQKNDEIAQDKKSNIDLMFQLKQENKELLETINELKSVSLSSGNNALIEEYNKKVSNVISQHNDHKIELDNIMNDQNKMLLEEQQSALSKLEESNTKLKEENLILSMKIKNLETENLKNKNNESESKENEKLRKELSKLEEELEYKERIHDVQMDMICSVFHGFGIYAMQEITSSNKSDYSTNYSTNNLENSLKRKNDYSTNK